MELSKIKLGVYRLPMVLTILPLMSQTTLKFLKPVPTLPLLTSGQMLLVKVLMLQMDSITSLAKVQDNLTILMQNSKILLTTVLSNSKLVINSSLRTVQSSVLNLQ